jgi:hypothetical protein
MSIEVEDESRGRCGKVEKYELQRFCHAELVEA